MKKFREENISVCFLSLLTLFAAIFSLALVSLAYPTDTGFEANYDAIDPNLSPNFRKGTFRPLDSRRKRMDFATVTASSHNVLPFAASTTTDKIEYPPIAVGDILVGSGTYGVYYATCAGNTACWKLIAGTTQAVSSGGGGGGYVDIVSNTIALWNFDEGSGNSTFETIFSTRFGQLITVAGGGVVWLSTGINNTPAVHIGASTGIVNVPKESWQSYHQGNFTTGIQSVSVWVYFNNLNKEQYILQKGVGGKYEYFFEYQFSSNKLRSHLTTSAGAGVSTLLSSIGVINSEKWNHLVWIVDKTQASGAKSTFYINGNLGNTTSTDSSGTTTEGVDPLIIGWYPEDANTHCDCTIDKLRFFNRRLTQEEVLTLQAEKTVP